MKVPNGWKWGVLDELVQINRDSLSEATGKDVSFRYIDIGSVDSGQIHSPSERIRFNEAPSRARRRAERGDILMSTVRPNLEAFAVIGFDPSDYVFSTGFAVLHPKSQACGGFVFQTLFSIKFHQQYKLLTTGSGYPAISATEVAGLELLIPPLPEQRRIAEILGAWDRAIDTQQKLITAKTARLRTLRHQLLTGTRRFPECQGKWRKLQLGEILNLATRPVKKPEGAFLAAGVRCHGKGVFLKPDFDSEDIALDELFQLNEGDLVVNITFAWEGAIAIVPKEADGALVSHRFPAFTMKSGVSVSAFLRHVITSKRFVYELGLASPGGAGRNRVLSKSTFLRIPVKLPSLPEQTRIATVLNAAQREIDLLTTQLESLKQQKRGLMQKLLTGEIRVSTAA